MTTFELVARVENLANVRVNPLALAGIVKAQKEEVGHQLDPGRWPEPGPKVDRWKCKVCARLGPHGVGACRMLALVRPPPPLQGEMWVVRMTRLSLQRMDDDNLTAAFKPCRDAIAAWLAIDDGNARIKFFPYQGKGASVVVPASGSRKRDRRLNLVRVEIRTEPVPAELGLSVAEARARAERGVLLLEATERTARELKKEPDAVARAAEWLGVS